jgi:hypothetical protein
MANTTDIEFDVTTAPVVDVEEIPTTTPEVTATETPKATKAPKVTTTPTSVAPSDEDAVRRERARLRYLGYI